MYVQVDELLRQLRMRNREHREGQQQAFYTIQELKDIFKKPLHQIHCTEDNFIAALKFINEVRMYVTLSVVGEWDNYFSCALRMCTLRSCP